MLSISSTALLIKRKNKKEMFIMLNPITAYIDPSVMTYAIQAVAGVVIAVGAVAALLWRKAKKKVSNALHLEEKSVKETEEEVQLIEEEEVV